MKPQNLEKEKQEILAKIKEFVGDKKHPNIDLAINAIESADCSEYTINSSPIVSAIESYSHNPNTALVMLTEFAKLAGAK
jgi:hypothetical protein